MKQEIPRPLALLIIVIAVLASALILWKLVKNPTAAQPESYQPVIPKGMENVPGPPPPGGTLGK